MHSPLTFATQSPSYGKKPIEWHPTHHLLSKELWTLNGYSINVNGFNTVTRATLNYFSNNFHVVGLQETRFTGNKTFQRAKHLWQATSALNSSFWSQDNVDLFTKSAGVGILITPTCPVRELSDVTTSYVSSPDLLFRFLLIRGTVDSVVTYIHVVYAPVHQEQRPQFFNSLPRHFAEDAHHIVMGDFNTVLSNQLDQSRSQEWSRRQGREELLDWMHELHLVDPWRLQHPNVQEFTSPTRSSRIDYVFVDYRFFHSQFQHIFHDFHAKSGIGDHIGLSFRLGSTNFKPSSRALWKCLAEVIKLPEAQDYLQASLQQLAASFDPNLEHYNPGCLLDEHKRRDSIFLRQLFHAKKNHRQRETELLHLAVNKLQHQQSFNPALDLSKDLFIAKAALQAKLEESAHFASKRKFASDIKASERCSKFFFRPTQILHKTPIPVDSAESLESTCADFNTYWSGIFCSPSRKYGHPKPQWDRIGLARLLQYTTSRLSPADRAYLDSPLTAHDFFLAFKHMASGKTPGPDGLPLAYYSTDLPLWSRIYEVVYGDQFQKGRMTKFQRRAQISLLYKHGDRSVPSNYRPISLLNVDAKLGPKILAHRLGGILSLLLHSDQYGFVPGRDIRHAHIRFQALTQLYSDSTSTAGAVLLDFANAFDSVVWDALDMVLMHFDFGHNFRRWVKVLFPGTLASLIFNGRPLAPFELGAGVRQGDPLSPALFVLFIEPLLNLVRTKLQGLGLQSGPTTHTVISFADDCTGLLHDLRHTSDFLGFVDEFCLATGMRLNKIKTVVLPFRPWNTSSEPLRLELERLGVGVVGNSGRTKLLGIYYGPQLSNTDRLHHILADMQARCLLWARRARTLQGQVLILQQVILPTLWYSASVCHIPATGFTDQVNTLISRFMCKSKSTIALSKDWWFIPPSLGGLGLTPVSDMIHSLHLHMLCKVILAARDHSYIGVSTWAEPVIRLFDQAIQPWGKDFDILYAPVSTSPDYANSHRFSQLGAYWQSVLFIWNTRLRKKIVRLQSKFDKLSTPMLHNVDITYKSNGQILAARSNQTKLTALLAQEEIFRPSDLFRVCNGVVTHESLSLFLRTRIPGRVTCISACSKFLDRVHVLLGPLKEFPIGPVPAARYLCAFHTWTFGTYKLEELSVARIWAIISKHTTPTLPLSRLGLDNDPPATMWSRDLKMGKHLLPVFSDLLFRLQHNALFLGYRFQHLAGAITCCHHGCNVLETPPHLFWYCSFAIQVWTPWITKFQPLFCAPIEWSSVLFFNVEPTSSSKTQYGYSLFVVFHIVRTVILRFLWTHRNDIRFHEIPANVCSVQANVHAVTTLHLEWFYQDLLDRSVSHSSITLRQLKDLAEYLQLQPFQASTLDTSEDPPD